ncbi:unnamed protein product [Sphagnum jensenii]|uniref:Uncharacterized protein n=1 Tax=Sphagnum jensenii TaxID=128206 RepID=A0ABP1ADV4_9BRYO
MSYIAYWNIGASRLALEEKEEALLAHYAGLLLVVVVPPLLVCGKLIDSSFGQLVCLVCREKAAVKAPFLVCFGGVLLAYIRCCLLKVDIEDHNMKHFEAGLKDWLEL